MNIFHKQSTTMRCKKAAFSKFAFALILCDFVRPPVA